LLRLLYNTGMRAQELVDLDANHLRFSCPYSVRIYGKGRKERTCPFRKETLNAVRMYLERRSVRLTDREI
jgi:integrase/recombinase XerC